nr:hypothetical protein GCM10020092_080220 [Actinoplanes digitatis]
MCAQVPGDAQHLAVSRQHFADQFGDATPTSPGREMFQQQSADSATTLRGRNEQGELGAADLVGALTGSHPDEIVTLDCQNREVPLGLRQAQPVHLGGQGAGTWLGEEPQAQVVRRGRSVQRRERTMIGGAHRPDRDDPAIGGERVHAIADRVDRGHGGRD